MRNLANDNSVNFIPHIERDDHLVLFDGVCTLCNHWCAFLLKFDKQQTFKLASVQSAKGQEILKYLEMPTNDFETMLVIGEYRIYSKSDAFFYVMSKLPYPWKILQCLQIFPRSLRNYCYDKIARNRYKIFGKKDYCALPNPADQHRFL
ncbi:thiol-disulfide oxidoreductase DCC family protein [Sessilibacter sp. MAH2]